MAACGVVLCNVGMSDVGLAGTDGTAAIGSPGTHGSVAAGH